MHEERLVVMKVFRTTQTELGTDKVELRPEDVPTDVAQRFVAQPRLLSITFSMLFATVTYTNESA